MWPICVLVITNQHVAVKQVVRRGSAHRAGTLEISDAQVYIQEITLKVQ